MVMTEERPRTMICANAATADKVKLGALREERRASEDREVEHEHDTEERPGRDCARGTGRDEEQEEMSDEAEVEARLEEDFPASTLALQAAASPPTGSRRR